jgi:hypothetical protein
MITRSMTKLDPNPFGLSAVGQRCFHCGAFFEDPAVMWSGADGQTIYFHGPCYEAWHTRPLWDALRLKYAKHPQCPGHTHPDMREHGYDGQGKASR